MWKTIRKNYRRLIASLLTMALVITNAGGNLGTIFAAGETENALFLLEGRELREAIQEAREQGEVFDFSALRLAAKRKSIKTRYEKLLGKKEGAVYALDLEIDDRYAPEGTELQVYYNAGTEDVIFLFLNGSDLVVDYRVNIDGYETEPVRVNPNSANIEADGEDIPVYAENYEAADMIDDEAKKLEAEALNPEKIPETAEEESKDDASAEETEGTTAADSETVKGNEDAKDETSDEKEAGGDGAEADVGKENVEETTTEEDGTEAAEAASGEEGIPDKEGTSNEEETPDKKEIPDAKETPDKEEIPDAEEDSYEEGVHDEASDTEDGDMLGISLHKAAIVTISLEDLGGGEEELEKKTEALAETEAEAEEETEAEAETESETEAETESEAGTEGETGAEVEAGSETESDSKATESGAETEAAPEDKAEGNQSGAETGSRPEESASGTEAGSKPAESESGAEAEGKPEGSETGSEAEGKPEESTNGAGAESDGDITVEETGKDDSTKIPDAEDSSAVAEPDPDGNIGNDQIGMDGQLLEDEDIEILGELKGKEYDTITILDHVNARAWKIALEDLEEITGSEITEYAVDYQVNVPEAATIKGAHFVAEGENLYFAVEPEAGFEIVGVYVNDNEAEKVEELSDLASASNWKGYAHVYVAEEVEEDLWIEVELEELPPVLAAATYTAETDDAVFTVNVPDGAFEEETELKVTRITEEDILKDLTEQAVAVLKENQIVAGVLAYDVAFISQESGEETEPQKPIEVSIRYKTTVVPEEVDEAAVTGISVVHLPENQDAEVVTTAGNAAETEIAFRADSLSPFVVTIQVDAEARTGENSWATLEEAIQNVKEGETICLLADVEVPYLMINRESPKAFTLDLNGKTIYGTSTYYVLYLYGGEVTIDDSSEGKTGTITHKTNGKGGGVAVNGGTLYMENGTICGNEAESGGGVNVGSKGVFVMNGGTIKENRATYGGGLYVKGKAEIKEASSIEGNTCAYYGGGVYVYFDAKLTMENGRICHNVNTSWYGGGVYNRGTFTMTGGAIESNSTQTSKRFGGGIYSEGGLLEIKDSKIEGNSNGGLYIVNGDAHLEHVLIEENTGNQPALYVEGGGEFSAEGCIISKNETKANVIQTTRGGTAEYKDKIIRQCIISDNKSIGDSYSDGNIISLDGNATFESCEILDNSTISDFGAATVDCGVAVVLMSDTRIAGNRAEGESGIGGIRQRSGSGKIILENTVITGNVANGSDTSCGGVCVTTGEFVLNSGAVYNNTSRNGLGDFRFDKRATWTLMKASEMKDPALTEAEYFKEYHYAWIGGTKNIDPMTYMDKVTSKDVAEWQGRDDWFLQASPQNQTAGVYMSGTGDDDNDALTPETAVKTLEQALKALESYNEGKEESEKSNTIYVTGTVPIQSDTEWDGHGVVLERDPSALFTGVMVSVEGGTLKLKDITLDGGALKGMQSYGLVKVRGGNLEINNGAVLRNSSKNLGNQFEGGGGVYLSEGTLTLNDGGKIMNNSSHNGGGVSIMSGGRFIMNGGEISKNTTDRAGNFSGRGYYTSGGGVFIAYDGVMEMNGGIISQNTSYDGGGISLGGPENDVFFKDNTPTFTMNGGKIDNNQSYSNGGGIFVQMNCVATIHEGDITNNHTKAQMLGANFGGGGIYVNGGKDSRLKNGLLQLYNVEITGNQANRTRGNGGVLAGCPTSKTKIYLTDGGVIHENGGANDLYLVSENLAGYSGIADLVISPFMLGGGAYHWTDEKGNELPLNNGFIQVKDQVFYAKTAVAGDAVTGTDQVRTHITGNASGSSYSGPGAAIGSNGDVIIGTAPSKKVKLTVEKKWNDTGYEEHRPESVDVRILQSKNGQDYVDVGFVRLSEKGGWKATVKDLPQSDEEGNDFIYDVREVPNGYDSTVTKNPGVDSNGDPSFSFVVTNTPTYALTLKKEVEGPAAGGEFVFKITLGNADGSPFSGEIETTRSNGGQGMLTFVDGEASVTLKKEETIQLTKLQPGMTYKIEETGNGGAKVTHVTIDGEQTEEAKGTVQLGGNINVVVFTNVFEEEKPETGALTVRKLVEGTGGETERDFRFRITLSDNSLYGEIGGLRFEAGISEEFTLKHDQSRVISDLPAGIGYTVEEVGAEELRTEGYEIFLREDGTETASADGRISGTIAAGSTISIICTNKKDTPDNPPPTPGRPGGGGGNPGGGNPGGGNPPGGPGTTTIEEPGVPLANLPPESMTELLEDSEVPLAALPKTGDNSHTRARMMIFGIAGLGMLLMAAGLRRRKDDSEG